MILGKTFKQSAPTEMWHEWFAWRPVRLEDGRWAFLETVRRQWRWDKSASWIADYSGYAYTAKA